eukprot:TRINITY_DN1036_c0_g2_i3.p1 TRINITY_DN1036_c0_g2~~TRINITY_DN1036_c0_g2_i3.p1  ORF type:complete len:207 (-),score=51.05 TRINITY_DN1036_c0_g2_i3:324-896(-)
MGKKRPANPFLDSKISNIYSEPKIRPTPTLSKKEVEPIVDLKSIQREVFDLGATTFRGKQKREWENQRLRARGGIVPKTPKTPYPLLLKAIKSEKRKKDLINQKQTEGQAVLETLIKKKTKKKRDSGFSLADYKDTRFGSVHEKRLAEGKKGLKIASVGKVRGGMLTISQREIHQVRNSSKRSSSFSRRR